MSPLDEGWAITDNTKHSQQTDIHVPGRIRNRNPSKGAIANPRLRQHDERDWSLFC